MTAPPGQRATDLALYQQSWADSERDLAAGGELQKIYQARLALIASPLFEKLPQPVQHDHLLSTGKVGGDIREFASAHPLLMRSSGMPQQSFEDWHARLLTAAELQDNKDSMLSLTRIAQDWPAKAPGYSFLFIARLLRGKPDSDQERTARFELLLALYHAHYTNEYRMLVDGFLGQLAEDLLERRRSGEALEVIRQINSPRVLLNMRVDRRFEALVRQAPGAFDVEAAAERHIHDYEYAVRRFPRSLDAIVRLCHAYIDAGRYQEALRTTSAALERVKDQELYRKTYDEDETAVNWLLNNHADAAMALGLWDEAIAAMELASQGLEYKTQNVSNVINLGFYYDKLEQPAKALRVLAQIGDEGHLSPFGRTAWHLARLRAAQLKGDERLVSESLEYLRTHQQDSIVNYEEALVQVSRMDEAAELLISCLSDPDRRAEALRVVQSYQDPPAPAAVMRQRAQWRELVDRADVQSAIAAVGRVESFKIPSDYD
jgi:tetratricopeptide (TPR) repeat protein